MHELPQEMPDDRPLLSFFDPPPARYRPLTPWPALTALVASVLMFAAATVTGSLAGGAAQAAGVPPSTANLVMLGVLQAALVALIWLAASAFGGRPAQVLALNRRGIGARVYAAAAGLMFAAVTLSAAIVWFLSPQSLLADVAPFARMMRSPDWPLVLAVVGIGAPASEELLFRGFLFSALAASRAGILGASILTSAIWTSLHAGYSLWGLAEVLLIGLLLSWLLVRTGTLWVPLACHAVYNTTLVLVLKWMPIGA